MRIGWYLVQGATPANWGNKGSLEVTWRSKLYSVAILVLPDNLNLEWKTLYVSGRLHKPVNILEIDSSNQTLKQGTIHTIF